MKNLLRLGLSLLFMLLLCPPQIAHAQRRVIPAVSVFVSGDYFAPKFDDVDAVYNTIEKNYFLPSGKDFKDYYSVMGGVRFSPVEQQWIQAELGASLFKSQVGNSIRQTQSINFLQMYYAGGTYAVNLLVGRVSFFIGAGLGYVWLNTQRTYSGQLGIAQVSGNLFQLHGTGGIEFFHPTGVSFALEGGYSYATTPFPKRADLDFTLKGVTGGIKISVPLINTF
ncbi:MAG: hypothetical protein M1470_04240 [Bacteroidetes bacterium]|nr:hypothetical protein [Bacteroidota bacterium]